MASFAPKGQDGLLLRSPLTFDFIPPSYESKSPTHVKGNGGTVSFKERQTLQTGSTPKKVAFYTRNNPHPARVRHMKGLLDIPICCVEDSAAERWLVSPPSGQNYGPPYRPPGSTRYGGNKMKGIAAVGVVPVTYTWRDELEKKAHNAISRALGEKPPTRAGMRSGTTSKRPQYFEHLGDDKLLELLCKILQTESIPSCQAWLVTASDTEKNIVLNMIRMTATGELDTNVGPTRPQTQYRYVWAPKQSHGHTQQRRMSDPITTEAYTGGIKNEHGYVAQDKGSVPFKFPEHDTVINTARQLSRLASRRSSRAEKTRSLDLGELGLHDHVGESAAPIQPPTQTRKPHPKSASFAGPMPTGTAGGRIPSRTRHCRSRSATPLNSHKHSNYPPPPVKVYVTQEKIRMGTQNERPKLQYTSHWESTN